MKLHKCSKCSSEYPWSKFQLYKGRPSGQCRNCKTLAMKEKRKKDGIPVKKFSEIVGETKLCTSCDQFKAFQEFSPSLRGLAGLNAHCKSCMALRARKTDNEVKKLRTKKYRANNSARWKALHRLHQFNRRAIIKITSDSSVTDELLSKLYSETYCFYCKEETPEKNRTIDHRVSLNSGGKHTAENLCMACQSCNSSKRDLTESEYRERLKNVL